MTDAFDDFLDDEERSDDAGEAVTSSHFTDAGVRTTLPDADYQRNSQRYESDETGEQADDVDPRGLFKQASLNELRYYAREGPYGRAIVKKPVEDIFKHGYEVEGDNTERDDGSGHIEDFLDEYEDYYKQAEIKSRRDGVAVLMHQIADGADSAADPIPSDGGEWRGFTLWTVDHLSDELSAAEVADHVEYEDDQLYVSEGAENGGVVIVDDISHPDHGDVVGYGVAPRQDSENVQSVQFVHADRCQRFTWGEHVDGPLGSTLTGDHVGESVLTPVLQPLKAAQMGFWAMKNILFRYSAPLHAIEPPESWSMDEWEEARDQIEDYSMASDGLFPPGAELNVAEGVSEFDPEPIYSVLVEAICSGTIFTKSVLQGTQSGTVSGSETDIKGYFNGVHNLRTQRTENKFREALRQVARYDQTVVPRVAGVESIEFNWGALFKPTDIEQADGAVSLVTGLTSAIKQYVLTPEEARSILQEEWAEFDIDVDLDELDEEKLDQLDRINLHETGQGPNDNEPESDLRQNPRLQNGGGQPEGQTRESSQPTRTSADDGVDLSGLSTERLQRELDEREGSS